MQDQKTARQLVFPIALIKIEMSLDMLVPLNPCKCLRTMLEASASDKMNKRDRNNPSGNPDHPLFRGTEG